MFLVPLRHTTYLQYTVAVHQQIARFDVPVENTRRVEILETAQDLVQEHFDMVRREVLR